MKYTKAFDYIPIGKRIQTMRKQKRYTQEYVSEKIGVVEKHLSEIERGISGLSIPTLVQVCEVLEVSSDYILFGKESSEVQTPISELMRKVTPKQQLYAEEITLLYLKSCLDE